MSPLPAWLHTPPPTLGLHLDAHRVTAVSVDGAGASPVVRGLATATLPAGALAPSLVSPNVLQRDAVAQAIRDVVDRAGGRGRRVALAVPDTAAKVSLLSFEVIPSSARDLEQLIRLQLRKTVPFPVEEAQVAWTPGGQDATGTTLVVAAMRRDVVEGYEAACAAAGLHAGVVDLATFNVMNLALAGGEGLPGDTLLVHVTGGYASIAVLRDGALIFFRTRQNDATEPVVDVVHQTRMFYEDRLRGSGFTRVLLVSSPDVPDRDVLARTLANLFEAPVSSLPIGGLTFADRVATGDDVIGRIAAPVGLVLRERSA